jgi:hypothetical protein
LALYRKIKQEVGEEKHRITTRGSVGEILSEILGQAGSTVGKGLVAGREGGDGCSGGSEAVLRKAWWYYSLAIALAKRDMKRQPCTMITFIEHLLRARSFASLLLASVSPTWE